MLQNNCSLGFFWRAMFMMSYFIHVYSGDSSGNGNPGIDRKD